MTSDIHVHPTKVTGLAPPLAAAVARHGLRADPCTNLRCLSAGIREAGDAPALFCKRCGHATVQPTRRLLR